jgi:signal transduction histidine kinase
MDISQAETGAMHLRYETIALRDLADQAVALFADEAEDRGLSIVVNVPGTIRVEADATRLRQVLANLIENAVKYTEPGGHITLDAEVTGAEVIVSVRDTGIGIAAEHLPFIWDRLYRGDPSRSARGLGLGLSLVKAIVEAHGGVVAVSSAPGRGSAFSIRLPATRLAAAGLASAGAGAGSGAADA